MGHHLNSKEFLQGKFGAGIRAAWVGEKTTTSFAIYVYIRNCTAVAFNAVNGTSLTGNLAVDSTSNVTITVTNNTTGKSAPTQTITDLTDDPLVWTDADSRNWTGLRVRRFAFEGLEPFKNYSITVETSAITTHDVAAGKIKTVTWNVRTLAAGHISGFSWGCDFRRWDTDDVDPLLGNEKTWFKWLDKILAAGNDISVCSDDPHYLSSVGLTWHNSYADPISLTSDSVHESLGRYFGKKLSLCELTTEEQITGIYEDAHSLVGEFFSVLLQPACLATGMLSTLEMVDGGDHLAVPNNGTMSFGDDIDDAFLITYDASGNTDYYATGGANFLTDLETMATMNKNYMVLMEYLFGRAVGPPPSGETYTKAIFNKTVTGQGTPTIDSFITKPIFRKKEHPLVDMFHMNCMAYSDPAYYGFSVGTAAYPVAGDRTENKTIGDIQRAWLVSQITASDKPFIIVFCGDPLLMVDENNSNSIDIDFFDEPGSNGIYGQSDGMGQKSRTERDALVAALKAIDKPILIMTCDHHCAAMGSEDNLTQVVCCGLHGGSRRNYSKNETRFTGVYTQGEVGFARFVVTEGRMYAYVVTINDEVGDPLNTDVAYVDKGSSNWQFLKRAEHKYSNANGLGSGLAILETM